MLDYILLGSRQGAAAASTPEEKWRRFFADTGRYWDNRVGKRNERAPDFKHKDTGEALWINDRCDPAATLAASSTAALAVDVLQIVSTRVTKLLFFVRT